MPRLNCPEISSKSQAPFLIKVIIIMLLLSSVSSDREGTMGIKESQNCPVFKVEGIDLHSYLVPGVAAS